jgi:hypothetical protein
MDDIHSNLDLKVALESEGLSERAFHGFRDKPELNTFFTVHTATP